MIMVCAIAALSACAASQHSPASVPAGVSLPLPRPGGNGVFTSLPGTIPRVLPVSAAW